MSNDSATVRAGEQLNVGALAAYLRGKVAGVEDSLVVEQFPGGHSNLTYRIETGGREYVLRRGPLGPVAPKAHDMAREYRVLQAVHPLFPPAPEVYLLCEDPSIIGAVFFLMERRNGIVLRDDVPPEIAGQPDHAARVSDAFLDGMVQLHAIDIEAHGLRSLGKPEGFLERQVRGWAERWQRAKTEELPQMDRVIAWLGAQIPVPAEATLVHNDYKLDNVMLNAGEIDRIEAVLDWEMTTVGDPLADLGLTLCYWSTAADPDVSSAGVPAISAGPGWRTRDQLVHRYASATGRNVERLGWYETLGYFKLAVILQQIYFRFHRGQTTDERFRHFDLRVRKLVEIAAGLVGSRVK
jgi:aminoglycoside phosphotransferase (APT) family kinase protein